MKTYPIRTSVIVLLTYIASSQLSYFLTNDSVVSSVIAGVLCFFLGLLVYCSTGFSGNKRTFGAHYFLFCLFAGFGVWLFGSCAGTWYYINYGDSAFDVYSSAVSSHGSLRFVLVLAVAPCVEELIVRGLFLRSLLIKVPGWIALFVSSILFAILHGTSIHMLTATMFGLLTGVVYMSCGRLWLCILLHSFYNALSLVMGGVLLPASFFTPFYVILLGAWCILCIVAIFKFPEKKIVV